MTGTGKIRRGKAFRSHLMSHRDRARKRHLRQNSLISKADEKQIKRLIPYA